MEPVTADELRRQLLLDTGEHDEDLRDFIAEARRQCETQLGDRALIRGTITEYFDAWPDDEAELHWGPNASTTDDADSSSVKYYDVDGTLQTLATSVYEVGYKHSMGILRLKHNQTWPTLLGHTADDIVVTYTVGYGTKRSDVPKGIRRWIKVRAAWMFENRDGGEHPWEPAMDSLLSPFATARVIGST